MQKIDNIDAFNYILRANEILSSRNLRERFEISNDTSKLRNIVSLKISFSKALVHVVT